MNEFIEKLIVRLEEEIKKINDDPWLDCEERIKKQCIYCNTIKIINELAEEYKNKGEEKMIDKKKLIEKIVNTPTKCLDEFSVSSVVNGIEYGCASRQNEIIDMIKEMVEEV